jgi:hypothetical protein
MHMLYLVDFLLQEMPSFRVLNCLTTFLAVSIFGITISASIVNWYSLSEQITLVPVVTGSSTAATSDTLLYNRTDVTWNLQQRTTSTYFDRKATSVASTYTSDQAIFSIIKLVQAFAITALLLSGILSIYFVLVFFAGFRAKIVYSWGATGARRIAMLTSLFVVISVVIAFLATTGITQALKTDNPICTDGKNYIAFIPTASYYSARAHFFCAGPCNKFVDSQTTSLGTYTHLNVVYNMNQNMTWGPAAGWFLFLACIPLSLLLTIVAGLNNYPVPIDSIGSGEAL